MKVVRTRGEEPKGAKSAITHYRVLERLPGHTVVEVKLETGRRNQIRVQFADRGFPLLGDSVYGEASDLIDRQALHAERLAFKHPVSGEMVGADSKLPPDFEVALKALRTQRRLVRAEAGQRGEEGIYKPKERRDRKFVRVARAKHYQSLDEGGEGGFQLDRPERPRRDGGDRPERSPRPRREGEDRPARPRRDAASRPERPERPRREGGESPSRPARPSRPRPEGDDRPERPRREGQGRPERPAREGGDRPGRVGAGGAKPQAGSRPARTGPRPGGKPAGRPSAKPSGRPGAKPSGRPGTKPSGRPGAGAAKGPKKPRGGR
jgi:hypothetical protein